MQRGKKVLKWNDICCLFVACFLTGSVLCPFLEDHKEDILCGPVWLASGLDLSGHAGMLSLTSPKLVKGTNGLFTHVSNRLQSR